MLRELAEIIHGLRSEQEIAEFLDQILTPIEAERLARRWELVRLLSEGIPQREVAARLGMSLCNVTRGARELKKAGSLFHRILADAGHNREKSL